MLITTHNATGPTFIYIKRLLLSRRKQFTIKCYCKQNNKFEINIFPGYLRKRLGKMCTTFPGVRDKKTFANYLWVSYEERCVLIDLQTSDDSLMLGCMFLHGGFVTTSKLPRASLHWTFSLLNARHLSQKSFSCSSVLSRVTCTAALFLVQNGWNGWVNTWSSALGARQSPAHIDLSRSGHR
jgi:hypothetical protein